MQKIAQRRGVLNRMREMVNAPLGGAAEKFFNPKFNEVMEKMREVDSNVRSIVAGKSLEGGDPGPNPMSFKDLLKSAKSNLNRREFMAAVADLSRFHKAIAALLNQIKEFDAAVDEIHGQFLVKDVGDEHLDEIRSLRNRWSTARAQDDKIIKEAGAISDFLHNWTNERGRALNFYEKRYEKKIRPFRKGIENAIRDGEKFFAKTLIALKEMATARATRNPDKYVEGISKIRGAYSIYDTAFKGFYTNVVKPISDRLVDNKIPTTEEAGAHEISEEEFNRDTKPSPPPLPSETNTNTPAENTMLSGVSTYKPTGDSYIAPLVPNIPKARSTEFGSDIEDYMQKVREKEQISNAPTLPIPSNPGVPGAISPVPNNPSPTMIGVAPQAKAPETLPYGPGMSDAPKTSHQQFYQSLESMANEHPRIIANYINKYAISIQKSDSVTAIKLLQIAKSVRG